MNWIIKKSKKLRYHTDLLEITKPFQKGIENYNWFLSDLDFITDQLPNLPINFDQDYFILSPGDFKRLILADVQIIWGVILAVPKNLPIQINEQYLPFVEGNSKIWEAGNIQLDKAEIEIDCFDSSYTIV